MPFSPTREEAEQSALLVPKPGWLCDISESAPVVYRDKKIINGDDFERERGQLMDQAAVLKTYADHLIATAPNVVAGLIQAANKKRGGYVVLKFTAVLTRMAHVDVADFCRLQLPVMTEYAEKTAGEKGLADYHEYYAECAATMEKLLARR